MAHGCFSGLWRHPRLSPWIIGGGCHGWRNPEDVFWTDADGRQSETAFFKQPYLPPGDSAMARKRSLFMVGLAGGFFQPSSALAVE